MNCEKAAESISALCDGERIPREVAEHLGACEECKARLNEYLQMSSELKRIAIIAAPQRVRDVSWGPQETLKSSWWQMWSESMRIPRFAFGLMLVAILSLGAGIVIVRANSSGRWFQFEVRTRGGPIASGIMSSEPKEPAQRTSVIAHEDGGTLAAAVRVLGVTGGSEKLGVRAIWLPQNVERSEIEEKLQVIPERDFWVIPGQTLTVPVKDYGEIEITGQLLDKLPDDQNPRERRLYPKEGQFQVIGPQVLLMDGHVLSKGGGTGLREAQKDGFFAYYAPHDGWYIFAFNAFPGATEGKINANQVEFTLDGKTYTLLAAAPIVDASVRKIWVRRHAGNPLIDSQPISPDRDLHASTMFGDLNYLLEHITKE